MFLTNYFTQPLRSVKKCRIWSENEKRVFILKGLNRHRSHEQGRIAMRRFQRRTVFQIIHLFPFFFVSSESDENGVVCKCFAICYFAIVFVAHSSSKWIDAISFREKNCLSQPELSKAHTRGQGILRISLFIFFNCYEEALNPLFEFR